MKQKEGCAMEKEKVISSPMIGVKAIYNNGELIYEDPAALSILEGVRAVHEDPHKAEYGDNAAGSRHHHDSVGVKHGTS